MFNLLYLQAVKYYLVYKFGQDNRIWFRREGFFKWTTQLRRAKMFEDQEEAEELADKVSGIVVEIEENELES